MNAKPIFIPLNDPAQTAQVAFPKSTGKADQLRDTGKSDNFAGLFEQVSTKLKDMPLEARIALGSRFMGGSKGMGMFGGEAASPFGDMFHLLTGMGGGFGLYGLDPSGAGRTALTRKDVVDSLLKELVRKAGEDDEFKKELMSILNGDNSSQDQPAEGRQETPLIMKPVSSGEAVETDSEPERSLAYAPQAEEPAASQPPVAGAKAKTLAAARAYAAATILSGNLMADKAALEQSTYAQSAVTLGGDLSAKYESNAKIDAVGYDRVGGTSYGKYQISSRVGSFDSFLGYLDAAAPRWADRLRAAGPADTGGRGGETPREWKRIASESPEEFGRLQHDFIRRTHYEPALREVKERTGIDVETRGKALAEVLWSAAVQHGAGRAADIFEKAATRAVGAKDHFDQALIKEVYADRSKRFSSSTADVQNAVNNRFKQEEREALAMLAEAGSFSRVV